MSEFLGYALYAASIVLMATGLVFVLAGAIGVMRLPDFYTRLHAAGVTDTLGAEMIIVGLMLQAHDWQTVAKLALVGLLLFLTSPTATHAVANAAHRAGLAPMLARFRPQHPRDAGAAVKAEALSPRQKVLEANSPSKAKVEAPESGDKS
ncbi:monovalent cation/H(+) antiporter subunit G [Maricaulis sp. CAU 1757]